MLSKQQIKILSSLKLKKFRKEYGLFLVEGVRSIEELLKSDYTLKHLLCDESVFNEQTLFRESNAEIVNQKTLERISSMKTASNAIAVVEILNNELNPTCLPHSVLIEDIQDPGNLGTIIRTAHWFGCNQVVCSTHSVDCYNPKVIQSSMGSVFKLPVVYTDLEQFINQMKVEKLRVIGTFLEGKSIYEFNFVNTDSFLLGNEGQGISKKLESLLDIKVNIPNFSKGKQTESLNIGSAASIFCSEMIKSSL